MPMISRLPLLAFLLALLLAGCASAPQPPPWQAERLVGFLPATCGADAGGAAVQPAGLATVQSTEGEVLLIAASGCVLVMSIAGDAAEPLPTRGDSIAPTMVDAAGNGLAFASRLSGSVRVINSDGAVAFNVSALRSPLGLRLMPGGTVLVAEYGAGRVMRLGPGEESRPRMVMEGLEGPVDLVVMDATTVYVSEALGGRITAVRLDRYEKTTLASGLARPEGLALMADGRLAVVETGQRRILAVDRKDGSIEVLADNLPLDAPAADDTQGPLVIADVAAAATGALYVSGAADRALLRVTPRIPPAP